MWFDDWNDVLRVVLVGGASYVALVVLLRATGKRTLAKLNAFDFVVTVALGSTLASIALDGSVSFTEGLTALWLLMALQFVVAAATTRFPAFRPAVTAAPAVLLVDGVPRLPVMRRHRIGLDELHQAVRSTGLGDLAMVAVVVLETDGTMSVISRDKAGDLSALGQVRDQAG